MRTEIQTIIVVLLLATMIICIDGTLSSTGTEGLLYFMAGKISGIIGVIVAFPEAFKRKKPHTTTHIKGQ